LRFSGNGPKTVEMIHTEEKGSDVKFAVHMLNDAWMNEVDSAVVVTTDSHISEAMRIVKKQLNKHVGLITVGRRHPSPITGTNIQKHQTW